MQWAIRNHPAHASSGFSSTHTPGSSGFIYVDSAALRRGAGGSAAAAAAAAASNNATELNSNPRHSMSNSASALARAFGIVVREVSKAYSHLGCN